MPWGKRDDMVVHEVSPYNAEPSQSGLARSDITAIDTFYSRNHATPNGRCAASRCAACGGSSAR